MDTEVALACWLGAHAVPAFAAGLLTLLGFVVALWRARGWLGLDQLDPPPSWRQSFLLSVLVVALGASLLFLEMTEALNLREEMGRFDALLAQALGVHLAAPSLKAFAALTHLGDVVTLTVLCIAVGLWLAWKRQQLLAIGWVLALGGNALMNVQLKRLFERARPEHLHPYAAHVGGFSFPSGHSSGALVAYGMLAYLALRLAPARWHLPMLLFSAATIYIVGCSRVMLQVHYASDVLGGLASGTLWLACCVAGLEWLRRRTLIA